MLAEAASRLEPYLRRSVAVGQPQNHGHEAAERQPLGHSPKAESNRTSDSRTAGTTATEPQPQAHRAAEPELQRHSSRATSTDPQPQSHRATGSQKESHGIKAAELQPQRDSYRTTAKPQRQSHSAEPQSHNRIAKEP